MDFKYFPEFNGFQNNGFSRGVGRALDIGSSYTEGLHKDNNFFAHPSPQPDPSTGIRSDWENIGRCFGSALSKLRLG